jgi:pimeloyl-ACP methyl ester carboxylesterase
METKTILAIHGIPGHHQHFKRLIEYFSDNSVNSQNENIACSIKKDINYRVIVPNLPNFSLTRQSNMTFWHSNLERAQLIRDFLQQINVSTIDCLAVHSAGLHLCSRLWFGLGYDQEQKLDIKSFALLSPHSMFQWNKRSFLVRLFSPPISRMARHKHGLKLIDLFKIYRITNLLGYPIRFSNNDDLIFNAFHPKYMEIETLHERLEYLVSNKFPTLIIFGENDSLISKQDFHEILTYFNGANQNGFNLYDDNGKLIRNASFELDWLRILSFSDGKHFAYNKYHDVINVEIIKLIERSSSRVTT